MGLKVSLLRNGGARRDRTADLLRATQALSQLSYSPNIIAIIEIKILRALILCIFFLKFPEVWSKEDLKAQ